MSTTSAPFKVWVSKYALTKGLFEATVTQSDCMPEVVKEVDVTYAVYLGEGREWHRTREEAVQRAMVLQQAQIASLEKKLTKLKEMTF